MTDAAARAERLAAAALALRTGQLVVMPTCARHVSERHVRRVSEVKPGM